MVLESKFMSGDYFFDVARKLCYLSRQFVSGADKSLMCKDEFQIEQSLFLHSSRSKNFRGAVTKLQNLFSHSGPQLFGESIVIFSNASVTLTKSIGRFNFLIQIIKANR